jgi:hypothetical protein
VFAQKRQVRAATVGFLNVENLWDTVRSADYIDGTKDEAILLFTEASLWIL